MKVIRGETPFVCWWLRDIWSFDRTTCAHYIVHRLDPSAVFYCSLPPATIHNHSWQETRHSNFSSSPCFALRYTFFFFRFLLLFHAIRFIVRPYHTVGRLMLINRPCDSTERLGNFCILPLNSFHQFQMLRFSTIYLFMKSDNSTFF